MASETTAQSIKGYELHEMLGEGGFGAVYRAYQPLVKREVAVKVILPEYANQPTFIRRFETEAQLVARLEHLHIVPLYDYWRDPSGAFLVMRLLRGGSLQTDIQQNGAWSLEDATRLMEQIASALSVSHRGGVVHRDLKPANILLDEERNAYLSDFGIAKGPGSDGDNEAGMMVGTPAYVAPEQIRGLTVTPQTDIYCLGLVMYEALTGQQAFNSRDTSQLIIQQLTTYVPPVYEIRPDLPHDIDQIIQMATAKDPDDRYRDVMAFSKAFKQATQGKTSSNDFVITKDFLDDLISVPEGTGFFTITPEMLEVEAPQIELVNPYKGLRAFQEGDSGDFFGREALTEQLIERLLETEGYYRFLAVVGPSGSGKSSVVKAGVIPALRRGAVPGSNRGFIVEMVPSNDAMRELEAALLRVAVNPPANLSQRLRESTSGLHEMVKAILPDEESELYLYIDQFEEVYTQTEDNAIRSQFMDSLRVALAAPDSRLRVMITVRADFYDKPLLYPEFGAMVRERTEVVLPLNKEELRSSIVGPASRVGVRVEEPLVQTIITEVSEEPGALPLLQYALTEVFERRSGMVMTLDSYFASGGVLGSLARRAEELYTEMTAAQQEAVRQLFLRLVTLGEGTEDTRRRILWSELVFSSDSPEDPQRVVLNQFGKYRLLTFDNDPQTREPTIEVAHEALIRQWKRLREWLINSREDVRTHRRLNSSATEWRNAKEDPSFLASGVRLQQFEVLVNNGDLVLTGEEKRYIQQSIQKRDAELLAEEARKAREVALERRVRRFLTALAAVLTLMAVGGFVLAGFAFNERDKAEQQEQIAVEQRGIADEQRIAAEEQREVAERKADETLSLSLAQQAEQATRVGEDPFSAVALVMEASRIDNPPADVQRTLTELLWQPGALRRFPSYANLAWDSDFTNDGRQAVTSGHDGAVILWDLLTGKEIRRFGENNTGPAFTIALSPDEQTVLASANGKTLTLWDVNSGEEIRQLDPGHNDVVWSVTFMPDGKSVITSSNEADTDNHLLLWDLETGEVLRRYSGIEGAVFFVDLSPDGKTMATGSFNGTDGDVTIWDIETGEILQSLDGHTKEVFAVAYSPDGKYLATGGVDTYVILWDLATGEEVYRVEGLTNLARSIDYSIDNKIAFTLYDSSVWMVDAATGEVLYRFFGHTGPATSALFRNDGQQLLTTALDGVMLWDLAQGSRASLNRINAESAVASVGFVNDQANAVGALENGTVAVWDVTTGEVVREIGEPGSELYSLAVSPDQQTALVGARDGNITLWEIESGEQVRQLTGHTSPVRSLAFSPDGTQAASGAGNLVVDAGRALDNDIILWDIATGEEVRRFTGHTAPVQAVAFSPDGTLLASGSDDASIILWDVASGAEVRRLEGHLGGVLSVAFSPDGQFLLSGGRDTQGIYWNVATGEIIHRLAAAHTSAVRSITFSPDGTQALSGAGNIQTNAGVGDTSLVLWDLATGEALRRFEGHTAPVQQVVFSADGKRALSASSDGSVRVWEIATFSELVEWAYANYDVFCADVAGFGANDRCMQKAQTDDSANATAVPAVPPQTADAAVETASCLVENPSPLEVATVETAPFKQDAPYVIGYSSGGLANSTDAYIAAWARYEASQHSDIQELIVLDAGGDADQQITQIEELIEQQVNALIINPLEQADMSGMQTVITQAKEAGIPVILVNHRVDSTDHVSYVGVDDFKVGCIRAQELVVALDGEGSIIRLNAIDATLSDNGRKAGAAAVFAQYPAIFTANEIATGLNEAETRRIMERTISENPEITGLWTYNGYIAEIAQEELADAGRPYTLVIGDQLTALAQLMQENNLPGSQVRIPSQMGAEAVKVALQVLQGESVDSFVEIDVEVIATASLTDDDLAAPVLGDTEGLPAEFLTDAGR